MDKQITGTVTIRPEKDRRTIEEIKKKIEEMTKKINYDFSYSEEKIKEWKKRINDVLHRRYIIDIHLNDITKKESRSSQ